MKTIIFVIAQNIPKQNIMFKFTYMYDSPILLRVAEWSVCL